jgi:hypothetical protein
MVSLRSRPFLPQENARCPFNSKLGGLQNWTGNNGKDRSFVSLRVMETISFLSSLRSSRYSDHATSAPFVIDPARSFQHFFRKLGTSYFCGLIVKTLPI